ncbi:MAG: DUF167 domain-containing protein [Kiloniellales bacterium]
MRVALRLQPGASRAGIDGLARLADGRVVLKARVGEPPEDGKANAALIKLLAKVWRLPKGAISIVAGRSDRVKTLEVAGDPGELRARLGSWLAALPRAGR